MNDSDDDERVVFVGGGLQQGIGLGQIGVEQNGDLLGNDDGAGSGCGEELCLAGVVVQQAKRVGRVLGENILAQVGGDESDSHGG